MPPAVAAAGVLGGAGLASGIIGGIERGNAADQANANTQGAIGRFYNFNDPDYEKMQLQLEQLKQQGVLTPEMEQSILQNPSALDQIMKEDPMLRQADLDSLSKLSGIANSGGMDAQAQLGTQQALNQSNAQAKGARDANLQNAAARGVGGSGLEFVSNQLADQGGANQAQMAGLQNAAAANQRDLSALQQLSGLTGQMNSQDYSRQQAIGNARNDINRFNTLTQQNVQQRNLYAQNAAQQSNLAEKQRIADANAGIGNQQQMYNKQLEQQKFNNNLSRAQGAAGLQGSANNALSAAGQASADLYGGVGKGLLGAAGTVYANQPKSSNLTSQQYQDQNGNWVNY